MVKDVRRGYYPGQASQAWLKVRTRMTAEAIVGGVLGPLEAPQVLLPGRPGPDGRLRVARRTGPLPPAARQELAPLLTPPHRSHPWPGRIPSSRFGQLTAGPVDYTQTEPLVVVEVDADVCWEQDRWRHATAFGRIRLDLSPPT